MYDGWWPSMMDDDGVWCMMYMIMDVAVVDDDDGGGKVYDDCDDGGGDAVDDDDVWWMMLLYKVRRWLGDGGMSAIHCISFWGVSTCLISILVHVFIAKWTFLSSTTLKLQMIWLKTDQ